MNDIKKDIYYDIFEMTESQIHNIQPGRTWIQGFGDVMTHSEAEFLRKAIAELQRLRESAYKHLRRRFIGSFGVR